jgi:hypothetical protein
LDQVVLELVVAQSFGLSSELWLEVLKVVVALGLEHGWGEGLGQSGSQAVDQVLLRSMLEFIENEVLKNVWVLLAAWDETNGSQSVLEIEGEEVGGGGFVVALGDGIGQRSADLVAESDAGEDLVLNVAEGLLNIGWNVKSFDVLEEVGTCGRILADQGVGLIVEVLELALAEGQELQQTADFVLAEVLLLERLGLVLELLDLPDEELLSFGGQVRLVSLPLELSGLLDAVLELEFDLKTKGQVLGIEGHGLEARWDLGGKHVLKLVAAESLGLVAKLRSELVEEGHVLALELVDVGDLSQGHGEVGCNGDLLAVEELVDGDQVDQVLVLLGLGWELGFGEPMTQVLGDEGS